MEPPSLEADDRHTAMCYRVLTNCIARLRGGELPSAARADGLAAEEGGDAGEGEGEAPRLDTTALTYTLETEWRRRLRGTLKAAPLLKPASVRRATLLTTPVPGSSTKQHVVKTDGAMEGAPIHPDDASGDVADPRRLLLRALPPAYPWRELVDRSAVAKAMLANCQRSLQLHRLKPGERPPPRAEEAPGVLAAVKAEIAVAATAAPPRDKRPRAMADAATPPAQRRPPRGEPIAAGDLPPASSSGGQVIDLGSGDDADAASEVAHYTRGIPEPPAGARVATVHAVVPAGRRNVLSAPAPDTVPLSTIGPGVLRFADGTELPFLQVKFAPPRS